MATIHSLRGGRDNDPNFFTRMQGQGPWAELLRTRFDIACRKRPVSQERIDKLLSSIQRQLETSGESEMASHRIGEMVMDGLKALDTVAYIRFASVYKDFREAKDFEDFAGTVGEAAQE